MRPVQEREDRLVESPAPVCEENVSRESNASPSTIHEANDMLQEEFHDASADPLPETSCPPETEVLEDCPVVEDRRYPTRDRKPPDYFSYHTLAEDREPQTYSQAMRDDDADKWKSAMQDEYDSLMKMNTWKLVDRPDRKIIPCKWVYKLKTDTHGNITRYKARLVIKGFNQVAGVDYHETFSPVIRHSSLRTLFALAAEMDLKMHHLDVDTAFLNGDLEEEVYMDQPQGFVKKGHEDKVCLLQKSLYGLKQAPRAWNIKLNETLSKIGFNRLPTEPCVYKKLIGSEIILLAIFVDDLIIFYKNDISYVKVKSDLQKYFSLKDLGPLKYYLGINIDCNDGKVTINQKSYITSLLKKYALQNAKEFDTPLANSKLAADSEDGPVSWASKKQPTVALSSTEAEYMALTEAAKEATYLRRFIAQVCSNNDQYPTITLYSDSQSAQNLAYNPVNHGRTKHIDTKFHFIREKVSDNIIKLKFISSSNMSADVLTKCLGKTAHQRCIQGLGLINLPS
ncbi:UDP-galactose 4'-epimerase isoform X3 [Choristoneura fumiferana]|uniref:UDP-galactose 4'-epimerase isoform X3 n=1 Tax=Choristoneura fumiferana TaxID=7141 RepID=UPI003D15943A